MNQQVIQMTFQELYNPQLQQLIGRIATTPMNGHKSYEIGKIARKYKSSLSEAREKYRDLVKEIVDFNEDGTPQYILDETTGEQNLKFKEGFTSKSEEFLTKVKEWESLTVDFDARPWTLETLGEVRLSAADFETLGKLFSYGEDATVSKLKSV